MGKMKVLLLHFAAVVGAATEKLFSQYNHAVETAVGAATVVFENFLYIQGPLVRRNNDWDFRISNTRLFAIDLKQSWNNRTVRPVTLTATSTTNQPVLFASTKTRTLYLWGGQPALQVFEFPDPSNPAKLGWAAARNQPPSSLSNSNGAFSARGPDALYAFGNWLPSEGSFIKFDASSNTWTRLGAMPYGNIADGAGLYIPTYGDQGVLVFLGGETPLDHESFDLKSGNMTDIRFYDIATDKFLSQSATAVGSIPSNRVFNCIVGAEDANGGGYDIFMYGGSLRGQATDPLEIKTVWVLTLPSFQWVQVPDSATQHSRAWHACEVIGQRQMVVAGGYPKDGEMIDEIKQGLRIFDMSALRWSDNYDPNATAYKRSEFLSNAIGKNSFPQRWDSPEVKSIFTDAGKSSSSDSNTAAIAAGVTVGVVGLTLVALVIWMIYRKRRRAVKKQLHEYNEDKTVIDTRSPSVVYYVSPRQELRLEYPRSRELTGSATATELPSPASGRRDVGDGDETPVSEHVHELPSPASGRRDVRDGDETPVSEPVYELPAEDHEVFPIRHQ